jgi:mannose-6-phosphate isomerase class I
MKIALIKDNESGKVYQTDNFKIYYRNKDTISGDNSKNKAEIIYLITGSAEITIEDKTWTADAPARIEIPAKTYHKIKALSDVSFVLFEN